MIRNLFSKLKSNHGESLGEVLVAVLIVALGSLLFASMVTASIRIVNKGKAAYSKNMNQKNQIEETTSGNSESSINISGNLIGSTSDDTSTKTQITVGENNLPVYTVTSGSDSDKEVYRYTFNKQ